MIRISNTSDTNYLMNKNYNCHYENDNCHNRAIRKSDKNTCCEGVKYHTTYQLTLNGQIFKRPTNNLLHATEQHTKIRLQII